jgi:hypothetical protein
MDRSVPNRPFGTFNKLLKKDKIYEKKNRWGLLETIRIIRPERLGLLLDKINIKAILNSERIGYFYTRAAIVTARNNEAYKRNWRQISHTISLLQYPHAPPG